MSTDYAPLGTPEQQTPASAPAEVDRSRPGLTPTVHSYMAGLTITGVLGATVCGIAFVVVPSAQDNAAKKVAIQVSEAQVSHYAHTADDGDPRFGTLADLEAGGYIVPRDDLNIEIDVSNGAPTDAASDDAFTAYVQSDSDRWFAVTDTSWTPQQVDHVGAEPAPQPKANPEPEPVMAEPVETEQDEPGNFWLTSSLIVLAGVVVGGVFGRRRIRRNRQSRAETRRAWAAVRRRHQQALAVVASYELDPALAIDFPAFNDVTVPQVSAMSKAMKDAREAESETTSAPIGGSAELLERYRSAVGEFEQAVQVAERTAKQLAWDDYSPEERKELESAKNLLAAATSPGNTAEARSTYYGRLQVVIRRLNALHRVEVIPVGALAAVESHARLELESVPA